jgi:hypothetical protein
LLFLIQFLCFRIFEIRNPNRYNFRSSSVKNNRFRFSFQQKKTVFSGYRFDFSSGHRWKHIWSNRYENETVSFNFLSMFNIQIIHKISSDLLKHGFDITPMIFFPSSYKSVKWTGIQAGTKPKTDIFTRTKNRNRTDFISVQKQFFTIFDNKYFFCSSNQCSVKLESLDRVNWVSIQKFVHCLHLWYLLLRFNCLVTLLFSEKNIVYELASICIRSWNENRKLKLNRFFLPNRNDKYNGSDPD